MVELILTWCPWCGHQLIMGELCLECGGYSWLGEDGYVRTVFPSRPAPRAMPSENQTDHPS